MKEITLTQGKLATIDDDDYTMINRYSWYALAAGPKKDYWYAATTINSKPVLMHRMIMNVQGRSVKIDHFNHDGLDNRRINLRACTHADNMRNRVKKNPLTSKYKGVWFDSKRKIKKWCAGIKINGKTIYIGSSVSEIEAAKLYDNKAREAFGEFALLNL